MMDSNKTIRRHKVKFGATALPWSTVVEKHGVSMDM